MNIKLENILNCIKEYKKQDLISVSMSINIDEFEELEKNRTEFCHELGKILGSCKIEVEKINEEFKEMQSKKTELTALKKENEQLQVTIENSLNLSNIEKQAKEKLGMQKLTNKQTVYVNLPKKDYIESTTDKVSIEKKNKNIFQQFVNKILNK